MKPTIALLEEAGIELDINSRQGLSLGILVRLRPTLWRLGG